MEIHHLVSAKPTHMVPIHVSYNAKSLMFVDFRYKKLNSQIIIVSGTWMEKDQRRCGGFGLLSRTRTNN